MMWYLVKENKKKNADFSYAWLATLKSSPQKWPNEPFNLIVMKGFQQFLLDRWLLSNI